MTNSVYSPVGSTLPFFTSDKYISMIVGPVGCLSGDVLVITENGPTPISDIDRPMRVLSWNAKTCQFQLSWCGGSFPKGRDYLYRVSTPEGEFDAAGRHLLLCADGEYRPVESLRSGDVLSACSGSHLPTNEVFSQIASHVDAAHCPQTDVDCLGGYAALARRCGQPFLTEEDSDRVFVPAPTGVQKSAGCSCQETAEHKGVPPEQRRTHSHQDLPYGHQQTKNSWTQSGSEVGGEEDRDAIEFCGHASVEDQEARLSRQNCEFHQPVQIHDEQCFQISGSLPFQSPSLSRTNRPILAVKKLDVKEAYWDIQVDGTENYVTVDGAVHHNSTKTTAGIYKIVYEAKKVAKCTDGIRRSRCAWIRQTRQMLADSSVPDFLKAFPDGVAGAYMKSEMKFFMKFDDVECEVWFRNLDTSDDIRRLLSTQYTFAVLEEFRECNRDIFEAIQGRLGRYPDGMMVPHRLEWGLDRKGNPIQGCVDDSGKSVDKVWMMSNPPDADSFWEGMITNPPENTHVTIQPSGLSEEADWVHLLKSDFYENLAIGKSEDWISVYIHAQFGKSLSGKPVFRSFNRQVHVAKNSLIYNHVSSNPLIVGMDTALHPSAVIGQLGFNGRLNIFHSMHSADMGALRFIREVLKPVLANRFGGAKVVVVIDPAGMIRSQTDESTVADILRAEGLQCRPAGTNSIAARIAAVDSFLTRNVDGQPGVLIDPEYNEELIMALAGKYKFKLKQNGEAEEKPDKSRPWSDLADGLQYLCLHADGGALMGRQLFTTARREMKPVASRGWV